MADYRRLLPPDEVARIEYKAGKSIGDMSDLELARAFGYANSAQFKRAVAEYHGYSPEDGFQKGMRVAGYFSGDYRDPIDQYIDDTLEEYPHYYPDIDLTPEAHKDLVDVLEEMERPGYGFVTTAAKKAGKQAKRAGEAIVEEAPSSIYPAVRNAGLDWYNWGVRQYNKVAEATDPRLVNLQPAKEVAVPKSKNGTEAFLRGMAGEFGWGAPAYGAVNAATNVPAMARGGFKIAGRQTPKQLAKPRYQKIKQNGGPVGSVTVPPESKLAQSVNNAPAPVGQNVGLGKQHSSHFGARAPNAQALPPGKVNPMKQIREQSENAVDMSQLPPQGPAGSTTHVGPNNQQVVSLDLQPGQQGARWQGGRPPTKEDLMKRQWQSGE